MGSGHVHNVFIGIVCHNVTKAAKIRQAKVTVEVGEVCAQRVSLPSVIRTKSQHFRHFSMSEVATFTLKVYTTNIPKQTKGTITDDNVIQIIKEHG
jgi:hypothetical protein